MRNSEIIAYALANALTEHANRQWLSEKPEGLSMEQAAVVGVPYLTAWLSLARRQTPHVEAGGLRKGEQLLITGASGAVGSAATQIAHWRGATVLAADAREAA